MRQLDILETDLTEEEIDMYANSIEDIYSMNYEESLEDFTGYDFDKGRY